jgi:hypothetical protein
MPTPTDREEVHRLLLREGAQLVEVLPNAEYDQRASRSWDKVLFIVVTVVNTTCPFAGI